MAGQQNYRFEKTIVFEQPAGGWPAFKSLSLSFGGEDMARNANSAPLNYSFVNISEKLFREGYQLSYEKSRGVFWSL